MTVHQPAKKTPAGAVSGPSLWRLPYNTVAVNEEGVYSIDNPPPESTHHFSCHGLRVSVFLSSTEGASLCRIWAPVRPLPFTAQNPSRRQEALDILRASRQLEGVKFAVDAQQMIYVLRECGTVGPCTLDQMVIEILAFFQSALPFIELLSELNNKEEK